MRRFIGIGLLTLLIVCATVFLARANASLREDRPNNRLPLIELTGDVPVCNTYDQFDRYVHAVFQIANRSAAILLVNVQFREQACDVIDARNLLAVEIVRNVDDDTVVVRGTLKHRTNAEKYFFFSIPHMFKRRRGAE